MFNFLKKMKVACIDHARYFKEPERKHKIDAGLDLYLPKGFTLKGNASYLAYLNCAVSIPRGYVGLILPRSSISNKGVHICTGVVDSGFVGEIKIVVHNMDKRCKQFESGMRIAQLVIVPCWLGSTYEVEHEDLIKITNSERGTDGYGSTGK